MVFVQCECDPSQAQAEVEWVTSLAEQEPRLQGIVAWAPLERGNAARDDVARLAENRRVKGVRRIIQFEPDPEFCLHIDFVQGVRMLADFDLSFDLCIAHTHLENAIQLVKQCPDVRFVVDHIGKPDIKCRRFQPWKTHLAELARMPNVWCKMSGLVVEADREHWTLPDLQPYIDHVLECFGCGRMMFGSDWPVVVQAATLSQWIETIEKAVKSCSDTEKWKLFHGNAIDFFRLGKPKRSNS